MGIKKFVCGFCRDKNKRFVSSRFGLRKHLKEEHRILTSLINSKNSKGDRSKQNWWIEEEW